jgi:formylglycine-generating enzyme required for sulfatase activity
MIALPAGSFVMGSPADEPERVPDEDPQHRVRITGFAAGQNEITFEQWDACAVAGGCRHKPGDAGWGRGKRPVINVSWQDAQSYARWLSTKTGKTYRLLSEAEWEYAARAGTTTPFAFGQQITTGQANFDGDFTYSGSAKGGYRRKTLPVGSLAANAWQLYDMHGNVWEWVTDCWHDSYAGAPADGSSWTGNCVGDRRVLRGGSWYVNPQALRSANRSYDSPGNRDDVTGFRLARATLTP